MVVGQSGIEVIDRRQLPGKAGAIAQPEVEGWAVRDEAVEDAEDDDEDQGGSFLDTLFGEDKEETKSAAAPAEKNGVFREVAPPEEPVAAMEEMDMAAGDAGQRHRGEEGKMGRPTAKSATRGASEAAGMLGGFGGSAGGGAPGGAPAPAVPTDIARMDAEPEPAPERVARPSSTGARQPAKKAKRRPANRDRGRDRPRPTMDGTIAELNDEMPPPPPSRPLMVERRPPAPSRPAPTYEQPKKADPYDGRFAVVMTKIDAKDTAGALAEAWDWRRANPGNELAILALGEAAEASGDRALAARAYGSLIDLFPGRADIRRMAGERLESLGEVGLGLAVDTFAQAVEQRPDHPSSHRLYAFALVKAGRYEEAFAAAVAGSKGNYPSGRFRGVSRILQEDLRLIAAAWLAARPADAESIRATLAKEGVTPDTQPSLRFVLNWETDANDVDFHIYDGMGGHAYYSQKALSSGGDLYADVTTGYGPECFTVWGPAKAHPYVLQAHYYSRGPMGYGMGKLQVIQHDGKGGLRFDERPYLIMKDGAFVKLGTLDKPL